MKKNKKQILLTIITILISTILFINKVDAVVMWMQCTNSSTDEVETNNKDFKYYNTYALINDVFNSDTRHLVYNPNDVPIKIKYLIFS